MGDIAWILAQLKDKSFNNPDKASENKVGIGENAGNHLLLLFQQCFLPFQKHHLPILAFCFVCAKGLTMDMFQNFCNNHFPNNPWFLHVCSTSLLKTLWEKEKLLVMSNFSFSHHVFYPFGGLSGIFIRFKNVIYKLFQFGRV